MVASQRLPHPKRALPLPAATSSGGHPAPPTPPLLTHILHILSQHKALNPTTISLAGKSALADYLIIANGTGTRHVGSLAQHIQQQLPALGHPIYHREGHHESPWVCLDCGDVIVHLFTPEARTLYNLEKLWGSTFPTA